MSRVEFKICGLTRPEDAVSAEAAGATYGGVILAPSSPRTVPPDRARQVFEDTALIRCGVFVNEPLARLAAVAGEVGLDVLQLHGDETPDDVRDAVRATSLRVWKAIRPRTGEEFVSAVVQYSAVVDGLLVDGWSAAAPGGTGARFPWDEVARWRERVPPGVRLIVAGGLAPENVAKAIERLDPDIVDVSSGVESAPGIKDANRIEAFATAISAGRTPSPNGRGLG